jgi:paired small multidrug resistance pump
MSYHWYDIAGTTGVGLIVIAYLLLQLHRLQAEDILYLALNAIGAALVIVSLLYVFNLSAFVMEAFWLLISVFGLIKTITRRSAEQ